MFKSSFNFIDCILIGLCMMGIVIIIIVDFLSSRH